MTKKEKRKIIVGTLEILTAAVVWGYGYIVIRSSFDSIPFSASMFWRYVIASAALFPLCIRKRTKCSKRLAGKGAILGFLLYISQVFQTKALGASDTTAGKVAFITAFYVVLVPFLVWLVFHRKPDAKCMLAAFLALAGLFLLTGNSSGKPGTGDLLALAGSAGFSVHILAIDYFTEKEDVFLLTLFQFLSAAAYAGAILLLEGGKWSVPVLHTDMLWPLLYLGGISTMLGFLMQLSGQKNLSPEYASVLLATESVFGLVFSVIFLSEDITISMVSGCVLIFAAVLLAQQKSKSDGKTK